MQQNQPRSTQTSWVTPIAYAVVLLLGIGIGIFLSFAYILFIRFSSMFALKGGLPPLIAVLIPNIVFGILGIYLLMKAPN